MPINEDSRCTDFFKNATFSPATVSPLPGEQTKFDGWSTTKAIFAVRDAHDERVLDQLLEQRQKAVSSPLQLELMSMFNKACPNPYDPPSLDPMLYLDEKCTNPDSQPILDPVPSLNKTCSSPDSLPSLDQMPSFRKTCSDPFSMNLNSKPSFDPTGSSLTSRLQELGLVPSSDQTCAMTNRLQELDLMPSFDTISFIPTILLQLGNHYSRCFQNNMICLTRLEAKRLPLAWHLSQGSGKILRQYAVLAAFRLLMEKSVIEIP